MKISNSVKYGFGVAAAASILGACSGGSQSPLAPSSPMLALPVSHTGTAATASGSQLPQSNVHSDHATYKLIDLGTFGGPQSGVPSFPPETLNRAGTFAGWADTSAPDPFPSFCFDALFRFIAPDCNVANAFEWGNGALTQLAGLSQDSAAAYAINDKGQVAGIAQNGEIDPVPGIQRFAQSCGAVDKSKI
ncbi:MAG: hypothetical protein WBW89_10850 [Candidatus Cybelea sp.]